MKLGPRRKIRWRRPRAYLNMDVVDAWMDGRGLTRKTFAKGLGVDVRTIRYWRWGTAVSPRSQRRLMDHMGLPFRELFWEEGE